VIVAGLPEWLADAIVAQVPDAHEAQRIARQWRELIPELKATSAEIRERVRASRCRCPIGPSSVDGQGRCTRCIGRVAP
jgi:hypothetical protein